jgi:hypothetical protein
MKRMGKVNLVFLMTTRAEGNGLGRFYLPLIADFWGRILVRPMRALLLVFVFAASALASDSLRELAADEYGPRPQAKEAGVDYVAAVKRAERADRSGLSTLFRVTKHLDGHRFGDALHHPSSAARVAGR